VNQAIPGAAKEGTAGDRTALAKFRTNSHLTAPPWPGSGPH